MKKPEKKRALSDQERRECETLNALYKAKKRQLGITQEQIAIEGLGANSQSAASHYLTGRNALNIEAAAVFARYLQEPIEAFSPRLAAEIRRLAAFPEYSNDGRTEEGTGATANTDKDDNVITADFSRARVREGEIDIPQYDVRGSMGAGQVMPSDYIETVKHITVSLQYLREQGVTYSRAGNLSVITGFGESMNRTFSSGDPLIIDQGVTSVVTDGVYLFSISGSLFVKRLQILPSGIRVISDNEAYPPYDITGPDLKNLTVHARVLLAWRSQRL